MVLARLLTPEAFGVIATITMVITFAEVFTDAGFQKYIVQHEFADEDELNKSTNVAFWTNFVFSVAICIGIFFFREPIAQLVGSPGLGGSISVASLLIVVAAFSSIQMARYKRAFDFKTLFYARVGTAAIPLVITVPLAFLMKNYWALLIGNFASQMFNAVILTVKSKWKPQFYYSFKLLKEMFSFAVWTLLESICVWLNNYIGVFIVGTCLSEYYLGIYKTSMSTISAYMAIITSAITPVLFSALSRYQDDEEDARHQRKACSCGLVHYSHPHRPRGRIYGCC
jgi:PST family polysaccharide transporter